MGDAEHVAAGYREFAAREARRSPLYAEWAAGAAGDEAILSWLAGLPRGKRQPNLLFAAVRLLAGTPAGFAGFRAVLRELELLVWPGGEHRLDDLHRPLAVARQDPPRVVRGDLLSDLAGLAAEAPSGATLVVFHTAALAYVPSAGRSAFADGEVIAWTDGHGAGMRWL